MTIWSERSPEVAALLNPAFCGVALYGAVGAFVERRRQAMPLEEVFLVLPLVLHSPTRASLPKSVASPFQSWVNGEPTIRVGLAERVRASVPITREAILYMAARKCLLVEAGGLRPGAKRPKMTSKRIVQEDDIRVSVQAAAMIGRLLAGAGTSATIYTSLGIAP